MAWQLAPYVSFCIASEAALFLDVRHDRYLALPAGMTPSFREWLERGCPSDLTPEATALLIEANLLETSDAAAPIQAVEMAVPTRSLPRASVPPTPLAALSAWFGAYCSLRRTRRLLETTGLPGLIAAAKAARPDDPSPPQLLASRFQFARGPRALEGDCLPASFAMLDFLHRRGSDARAVFGVIANPFRAHCWLQSETEILNDDADHVSAFTPILVV